MPFDEKSKDQAVEDDKNPYMPFGMVLKLVAIMIMMFIAGFSCAAFFYTTSVCPLR